MEHRTTETCLLRDTTETLGRFEGLLVPGLHIVVTEGTRITRHIRVVCHGKEQMVQWRTMTIPP